MTEHYDMDAIKSANRMREFHWFDRSSLRFFNSRPGRTVFQGPGGVYFTSSEQFDHKSPRLYTVRRFNPETGDVTTAGKFQQYDSSAAATRAAKRHASGVDLVESD